VTVALISDVHGNAVALDAVLADMRGLGVDEAVCLGDMLQGGPQPREVLARLRERGWPVVLGNADAFLLDPEADPTEPPTDETLAVREWTLAQLGADADAIRAFAPTIRREVGEIRLLAFHATPTAFNEARFPDDAFELDADADVLAGGHTHTQWTRRFGEALFVNPGSVGFAFDRFALPDLKLAAVAEYALLHETGGVEFRRVPFDLEALAKAARGSGRPEAESWIQRWPR
jgi:putative phosphoesterase